MVMSNPWFISNPEVGEAFLNFFNKWKAQDRIDEKTSEMIKLALACAIYCPHCIEHHVKGALESGASKEEVSEMLLIGAAEASVTQMYWRQEVFKKYLSEEDHRQSGRNF